MSYNDYMKNLLDMQQEGMKFWQNQMEELGKMGSANVPFQMPMSGGMVSPIQATQELEKAYKSHMDQQKKVMDSTQQVMQTWADLSNQFLQDQMKTMQNPMENMDLHAKMVAGRNVYNTMAEEYAKLISSMGEAAAEPYKNMDAMRKQYAGLFAESILNNLPGPFKDMASRQLDMYKSGSGLQQNLFQPWIAEANDLQRLLILAGSGNTKAAAELLQEWQSLFSQTFGRALNLPVFSMNSADMKDMMNVLDAYISFLNSYSQFMLVIIEEGEKTFVDLMEDFQEMVKNDELPATFKGFYDYWVKTNEKAYKKLFATDSFAELMNHTLDHFIRFKKGYDQLINNFLKLLPLPSTDDMNSVYKKIDTLKRDVRELQNNNADVSAYETKIAELEKENTSMKTSIRNLQTNLNALKKEAAELANAPAAKEPPAKK